MGLKYLASLRTILAVAYLRKGNIEKFKENFYKIFDDLKNSGEDIFKIINYLNQTFILIEDEKFEKIADEINKVLKFSTENNIKVEILRLIEKSRRLNMNLELSILEKLASSKFEKLLVKK
ncbi:glycosyl transferase family protein [Thermosipho africanus H17ap60334]|uniref:hypothetical protein n=1 Tax=Thermosipho africanus TaxID=2421 RepID=UPI00028EC160|nr:hypothetical protein [Thermosipho africanus]EKF49810.1 glycosyl transferase family protein [Thermosipho africanus H17ap60334]